MSRKVFIIMLLVPFFSLSPLAFAGEMERFDVNSNQDLFGPVTENMGFHMRYQKFEIPLRETALHSHLINHVSNPKMFESFSKSHLNNPISRPYMEPVSPMMTRWDGGIHDHMQNQFERSFVNSVPDPSAVYLERKLKNDLYKTANTMISVGTAAVGGPLSKIGAISNIIHNFGPQTGTVQNVSGTVGDVVSTVGALKTAHQAFSGNFSNLGSGVVGIVNTAFGNFIDAHKMTLMEPVTTLDSKHYGFATDDGFTRTQRVGTITVNKTYTPPATIKAFGPPGIFEGTTTTRIRKHEVMTTNTGNFNAAFSGMKLGSSNIKNYHNPSFTGCQTFKSPTLSAPSFKEYKPLKPAAFSAPSFRPPAFRPQTFRAPSFRAPTFRMPTFRAPSFQGIR